MGRGQVSQTLASVTHGRRLAAFQLLAAVGFTFITRHAVCSRCCCVKSIIPTPSNFQLHAVHRRRVGRAHTCHDRHAELVRPRRHVPEDCGAGARRYLDEGLHGEAGNTRCTLNSCLPNPCCIPHPQNVTRHPGYNPNTLDNDIAIIVLKYAANTTRNRPAVLPAVGLSLESKRVTVAGYGTTETQAVARVLK